MAAAWAMLTMSSASSGVCDIIGEAPRALRPLATSAGVTLLATVKTIGLVPLMVAIAFCMLFSLI